MNRHILMILTLVAPCLGACSSSTSSPDTGAPATDSVHPPSNIDITSCASIDFASDSQQQACSQCCMAAGFAASSFANHDHCTCGREPNDAGASACSSA